MHKLFIIISFTICLVSAPLSNSYSQENDNASEEISAEKLNINFENADIRQVLQLLALKGRVNIVTGPEVRATVSINLKDVTWEEAFEIILTTYGYGYDRIGKALIVEPVEKLRLKRQVEKELTVVQLAVTEVFTLKYIDANDMKAAIEPQLSPQGKVTILQESVLGWAFDSGNTQKKERKEAVKLRSNKLVVSDIPVYIEAIRGIIGQLDIKPRQVLIQARIIEVNKDYLKDIGLDWGTGGTGAESSAMETVGAGHDNLIGGQSLGSHAAPSSFLPSAGTITGTFPYNTGLSMVFQKLSGSQFEVIFHALEENVNTNIMSAPHIVTLDGREATILVGTKFPILKANTSGTEATTVTASLDYYENIGIQLNVIPKIVKDNSINMVIHPAITDFTETLKARGSANQIIAEYPIIQTREAETNVFINDGETIVVGGLLKDVKKDAEESVPFLSKIPLLGLLFKRDTVDKGKVDLVIFITANIIDDAQKVADIVKQSSEVVEKEEQDAISNK